MRSIVVILLFGIIPMTIAADFEAQSLKLCEKIKSCALAELEGQELSPEMKSMVVSSMDGMCDMMTAQFSETKAYEDIQQQASACMDSLSSLSCTALMEGENQTPACIELERRAGEYE